MGQMERFAGKARTARQERCVHLASHRTRGPRHGMVIRVAIVGCGLIGQKRARALGEGRLVAVADTELEKARQLAAQFPGCVASQNWEAVVRRVDVDVVIVATTNNMLAPITAAALERCKHVLVEKPAA